MAIENQRRAARENGAKSHGPATPEGRDISKYNALKHGFTARVICISTENKEEFAGYFERTVIELDPQDQVQMDLVRRCPGPS